MHRGAHRARSPRTALRLALIVFVLAWLFGPGALQSAVPIWLVFAIALGLEVQFFLGALRPARARAADRGPQAVDRERYGYADESDELVVVRDGDEELWIPYSGESREELETLIAAARERREEQPTGAVPPVERPRPVWPALSRLLVGLGVIGALALLFWVVDSHSGWNALGSETQTEASRRFSDEASRIAGKPVTIHCDTSGDYVGAVQHADGVAAVGGDFAFITPERCLDLYRLAFKGQVTSSRTARAIAVLAHESWHLRGVRDEGTTECYALQTGVELGRRLGLSEGEARRMMRQQLAENALHAGGSFEYRVPAGCRDGGRLDLRPGDDRFP